MMSLSAYRNLVFGVTNPKDVNPQRVAAIVQSLELTRVANLIKDDLAKVAAGESPDQSPDLAWLDRLTSTEKCRVHLARALIMNPEVLVLQKPLSSYSPEMAKMATNILSQYVRGRGLCLPEAGLKDRRPRTLFYSTVSGKGTLGDEVVWELKPIKPNTALPCSIEDVSERFRSELRANWDPPTGETQSGVGRVCGWGSS